MKNAELIKALQNPTTYTHQTHNINLIETYISWVFLTGDYVYKVKKPVNFDYLDFSTLEQRKYFCDEEIRLNKRLAPEIYLDVVAITQNGNQIKMGGEGTIIDYAVRMVQFDTSQTLDILAKKGLINNSCAHKIGLTLANFHLQLKNEPPPTSTAQPQPGTPEAIWAPVQQNFKQIREVITQRKDINAIDKLNVWSSQQFKQLRELMQTRLSSGFVRECHGDLHLGNMVMLADDHPQSLQTHQRVLFFDCIEFNNNFRQIDVACELAFTLMDLDARKLSDAANIVLNTYLEYTGDYSGLALINFYKAYFAVVRAKVNLLQIAKLPASKLYEHDNYKEFTNYINLAISYTFPDQPFVVITHGLSGCGKSTVAKEIAKNCNAICIRSDVERKRLFDLSPTQASDGSIYTAEISDKTFTQLHALVEIITSAGLPCIVDATFLRIKLRRQFQQQAISLGLPFHILDCKTPDSIIHKRLAAREKLANDASEATLTIMLEQQSYMQAFTPEEQKQCITVNTTEPLPLSSIIKTLREM